VPPMRHLFGHWVLPSSRRSTGCEGRAASHRCLEVIASMVKSSLAISHAPTAGADVNVRQQFGHRPMQQVAVCRLRGESAQLVTVSLKVEQARGLGGPVRRAKHRARLRDPVEVQRVGDAAAIVALEVPTPTRRGWAEMRNTMLGWFMALLEEPPSIHSASRPQRLSI